MGKTELKLEIDAGLDEQARVAAIQMTLVLERALKAELGEAAAAERARRWAKKALLRSKPTIDSSKSTGRSAPSGAAGDPPVRRLRQSERPPPQRGPIRRRDQSHFLDALRTTIVARCFERKSCPRSEA
jgi:hypothetical protein